MGYRCTELPSLLVGKERESPVPCIDRRVTILVTYKVVVEGKTKNNWEGYGGVYQERDFGGILGEDSHGRQGTVLGLIK